MRLRFQGGCIRAILIVLSLLFITPVNATETRGLRVIAKEVTTGESKEVKLYNKSYAVIIGIDSYSQLSMTEQLTYAVRDAKGVESVLRSNYKFDKIITLYNQGATKDSILKVLMEDLPNEMTEEDSLFVFWAGHGNQETTRTGDLGYLVPHDGNPSKLQSNISMTALKEDISKKLPAKHVFYVMDACYSGLLTVTRGLEQETKRDVAYLQEITKEPVRQVLTAGGKNQKVLDGGPKGHSVFTGRLIEQLENAEDFVTANELQAKVSEKVFSDASSMSATQTPSYGKLYGLGDFVFVPSLEKKVEDIQEKIDAFQAEMNKLNKMEQDAANAMNEELRRQAEIEKNQILAKIAAEKLRQQTLDEQKKKREAEQKEEERRLLEATAQKKKNEERIARLSREVEEKRKAMGDTSLSSLSPQSTLDEMQSIDRKIKQIKQQFRTELKDGILQVINRFNPRYLKLADAVKDEFETEKEFLLRRDKERFALDKEQADEFDAIQTRLEDEYKKQITPFIETLKKLSGKEFHIASDNLLIELGTYDSTFNVYPITIKSKNPLDIYPEETASIQPAGYSETQNNAGSPSLREPTRRILLAANGRIPIPRDEAREFKQHFLNNMLRAELRGNFETPENFTIAEAKIIDDATVKSYDLFTSTFVDLGNGTIYDTTTKLIWCKNANPKGERLNISATIKYINYLNKTAYLGFRDWRLPNSRELLSLYQHGKQAGFGGDKSIIKFLEHAGFENLKEDRQDYISSLTGRDFFIDVKINEGKKDDLDSGDSSNIWPVRSGRLSKDKKNYDPELNGIWFGPDIKLSIDSGTYVFESPSYNCMGEFIIKSIKNGKIIFQENLSGRIGNGRYAEDVGELIKIGPDKIKIVWFDEKGGQKDLKELTKEKK